jgi:hypothetical protein
VKGNYLTGAPSFKSSESKYTGQAFILVDSNKATGEFNFSEASAVDVSDTIFSEKIGPIVLEGQGRGKDDDGYRVQSTVVRQSLELRDATRWVFDCSRSLLFPEHGIDWVSATVATHPTVTTSSGSSSSGSSSSSGRSSSNASVHAADVLTHSVMVNGSIVVVETSYAVSALVSIEARQGRSLAGTPGIV